jgi:hypothetical protein
VITEKSARMLAADGREEKYWTTLPAWSAQTQLDLKDASVGFPTAASALAEALDLGATRRGQAINHRPLQRG